MRNFIKGLTLFTTTFGILILSMMIFILTTKDVSKLNVNWTGLKIILWISITSFCCSCYFILPIVFRESYWMNQEELDKEKEKYQNLQKELQRKIDKL